MHASGLRRKRGSMSGKRRMRTGGKMRGGRKGSKAPGVRRDACQRIICGD